jgi:septal ring factor EnvC (AmiA/AmiB activator)
MKLSSRTLALVIVGLAVCLYGAYRLFSSPTKKQETEKNLITSSAISSPAADFKNEKNHYSEKNENSKDVEQLKAEIYSLRQQVAQLAAVTSAKAKANKPEEKDKSPEGTMFDPKMVEKSKKRISRKNGISRR